MRSLLTAALLIVGATVAGCASAPSPSAPLPSLTASRMSSPSTSGLTITDAREAIIVPAPVPGHSYPVKTMITINGTDGGKRFNLIVETFNPEGSRYVAFVKSVSFNNVLVKDQLTRTQWSKRLSAAAYKAPSNAQYAISMAVTPLLNPLPATK